MSEVNNDEPVEWKWKMSVVKCRLCGHEHVSVYPENIDNENEQECWKCGKMTAAPVDVHDDKTTKEES